MVVGTNDSGQVIAKLVKQGVKKMFHLDHVVNFTHVCVFSTSKCHAILRPLNLLVVPE